jgi:hypothetical protein
MIATTFVLSFVLPLETAAAVLRAAASRVLPQFTVS